MSAKKKKKIVRDNFRDPQKLPPHWVEWWDEYGKAITAARLVMDYYQPIITPMWTWR